MLTIKVQTPLSVIMKWVAPTNTIFSAGVGGVTEGKDAPWQLIIKQTPSGVTYRVGSSLSSRILSSLRGGVAGAAGFPGRGIGGAIGVGIAIGLTGVVIGDSVIGREAFLRNAIKECNCGSPNATNKVDPSFFQLLWGGGDYGAAQAAIQGY